MGREALRQVKPGFMRDTLAELQSDGWTIHGTNGGHVRLEHPGADKFIIAPKTASDHRSALNVRADCRRALKLTQEARLLASTTLQDHTPPIGTLALPETLSGMTRSRRKERWNDTERTRRDLVAAVQAAAPSQTAIDEALHVLKRGATLAEKAETRERLDAQMTAEAQRLDLGPAAAAPDTAAEVKAVDTPARGAASEIPGDARISPLNPEAPELEAALPETAGSGTTGASVTPSKTEEDIVAAVLCEMQAPNPAQSHPLRQIQDRSMLDSAPLDVAPAAATRPMSLQAVGGLPLMDAATLCLAMRILSGEMRQVAITPDMVGMTLAYDGELILVEAAPPAVRVVSGTPAPRAEAPATPAPVAERRTDVAGAVLRALTTLGDWVANMDLCDLLMAELGRSNVRSANNLIGPALASLRERGLVETREERDGRALKRLHRALPTA